MTYKEYEQLQLLWKRGEMPNTIRLKNGNIAILMKKRLVKNINMLNYAIYRSGKEELIISINNLHYIQKVLKI